MRTLFSFCDALQCAKTAHLYAVMSHEEIAAELGISRQRVAQLERKALRKLRERHPNLLAEMFALATQIRGGQECGVLR